MNESYQDKKTIEFFKKHKKLFYGLGILVAVFGLSFASNFVYDLYAPVTTKEYVTSDEDDLADDDCSVIGINLHGTLVTYIPKHSENDSSYDFDYDVTSSEDILWTLGQADANPNIEAIIIEVDSGGGSAVAGEEISKAIEAIDKPVIVFIREMGASASYWAISDADKIFASKNSNIGSIGVTQSYLQKSNKNKKEGYEYIELTTGRFKDTGSPDKPITAEERQLLMRDLKIIYHNFVEAVSKNRNLSIQKVEQFADGSTVLGLQAKELGLIDDIGGLNEVEKYLKKELGEEPSFCWE